MVYTGKLSKACQPCRDKRRKCDLKRPHCSPCTRTQITCFGYRNTTALMVRDETSQVVQKARETTAKNVRPSHRLHRAAVAAAKCRANSRAESMRALMGVSAPAEEISVVYFLFVFSLTSPFSYLAEHMPTISKDSIIMQAMYAPALAAMGLQRQNIWLLREARHHYGKALTQTNMCLADPITYALDRTLLCVLLLSAFEALMFRGRGSPSNWTMHVQGSIDLLTLRDPLTQQTPLGRQLFHHASINILISCVQQRISVPETFLQLLNQIGKSKKKSTESTDDVTFQILTALTRVAKLRAGIRGMMATEVVRECLDLDRKATELMDKLYSYMPFKTINVKTDAEELEKATRGIRINIFAHKNIMHIYESQASARAFNTLRLMRVVLYEWVFCAFDNGLRGVICDKPDNGSPLHEQWSDLPDRAVAQAGLIIDGMLSSVPYSLELLQQPFSTAARSLIWPLATTAASEVCPLGAKLYIIDRLKSLAAIHDFGQAKEAALMLEEGSPLEDW